MNAGDPGARTNAGDPGARTNAREAAQGVELSAAQTQLLRGLLHARYRNTLRDIELRLQSDPRAELGALRELALDEGDAAVSDVLADTALSLIERESTELRDIEAALQRLRAQTIAQCLDCGGAIAFDRLAAYPTAKRCIQCQRRHERSVTPRSTPSL